MSLAFVQQALINEEQKGDVNKKPVSPTRSRDSALQVEKKRESLSKAGVTDAIEMGTRVLNATRRTSNIRKRSSIVNIVRRQLILKGKILESPSCFS